MSWLCAIDTTPETVVAIATVGYVIIAFLTMGVLTAQLVVLRSQTRLTRALERPWVAFELRGVDGFGNLGDEGSSNKLSFNYAFVNGGKTVARINAGAFHFAWVESAALPSEPDYAAADENRMPDLLLFPGHPEVRTLTIAPPAEALGRFARREVPMILYGFIRYGDVTGKEHETRFSMICRHGEDWPGSGRGFHFDGPKAYNRAT